MQNVIFHVKLLSPDINIFNFEIETVSGLLITRACFHFICGFKISLSILICGYQMQNQSRCIFNFYSGYWTAVWVDSSESKPRKKSGAAFYKTKFDLGWSQEWSFIKRGMDLFHFLCTVCNTNVPRNYQGLAVVKRHLQSRHPKDAYKHSVNEMQASVSSFLVTEPLKDRITSAEVKFTVFLAENNLQMATADNASRQFKSMFLDSQIAKKYSFGS